MRHIRAIWRHQGSWYVGGTPDHTILLSRTGSMVDVEEQVSRFARRFPSMQAFGLLPYEGQAGAGVIYLYQEAPAFPTPGHLAEYIGALSSPLPQVPPPQYPLGLAHYQSQFNRIQEHLRAGDVYQINYAERFEGPAVDQPLQRWLSTLQKHPAPHACYVELPEMPGCSVNTVMSFSPERLIRINQGRVVTEPIKGSTPRGQQAEEDKALGQALLDSEKNRAENLMIVDLLRNDLGKICMTGSVTVDRLFELRTFPTIQHLVSTISGNLRPEVSPLEALASVFPGGSITGAPKIKAMDIINQLEAHPRHFYCGSAFSLDAHGNLDANILIRTFQQTADRLYCHAGGGIVIDSDMESEFQEMHFKIEPLIKALCGAPD